MPLRAFSIIEALLVAATLMDLGCSHPTTSERILSVFHDFEYMGSEEYPNSDTHHGTAPFDKPPIEFETGSAYVFHNSKPVDIYRLGMITIPDRLQSVGARRMRYPTSKMQFVTIFDGGESFEIDFCLGRRQFSLQSGRIHDRKSEGNDSWWVLDFVLIPLDRVCEP